MPRLPRAAVQRAIETAEQELPQPAAREIREVDGRPTMTPTLIETVDKVVDKEWADQMAFNAEKITIVVNEDTNPNAENPVYCSNNGDLADVKPIRGWLFRGKEYTIERRFLESIMRAKITTYTQKDEYDANGTRHIKNIPHVACRYNVRVMRDDNPLGVAWLKQIMQEAP